MKILAIDLGKSKMVGPVYDTQTHEHRFDGAPLDRGTLRGALDVERPDRLVIEVGPSAGWVGDVIRRPGVEPQVANPNHEGWRWRNVKRKTDRLDALKLAQLSASHQSPQVHLPARNVRQWPSLIDYRHRLVTRRTVGRTRSVRAVDDRPETRRAAPGTVGRKRQLARVVPASSTGKQVCPCHPRPNPQNYV